MTKPRIKLTKKSIICICCALIIIVIATVLILYFNRSEDNAEKLSWKEVSELAEVPENKYSNITFAENCVLILPDVDTFYQYQLTADLTKEETLQLCYDVGEVVFPGIFSKESQVFDDSKMRADVSFSTDELSYRSSVYAYGKMVIYNEQGIESAFFGTPEKIIRLSRGDSTENEAYTVNGESYMVSDALALAEETVKKLEPYMDGFIYKPTDVIVIKDKSTDNYSYHIQFEAIIDSVPINDGGKVAVNDGTSKYFITDTCLYVTISSPGIVAEVYRSRGVDFTDKEELKDEFITLEAATEKLAEYYAPYYKTTVSEISVKYAIKREYGTEEHTIHPYWCFIIDYPVNLVLEDTYCMGENTIYVDMVTGEVISYFRDAGQFISSFEKQESTDETE